MNEFTKLLADADQEAKAFDLLLDDCIQACQATRREKPELDEVRLRCVQIYLINKHFENMPRQGLIVLLATALTRLSEPPA